MKSILTFIPPSNGRISLPKALRAALFAAFLCLCTFAGRAQTTIYSQNFGTTAVLPTGWTTSGANVANLAVSTSSVSSTYTTPISFSAGANLADNGGTGISIATLSGQVSTIGYNNIQVIYGARRTSANTTVTTFEWSSDGTTWNSITYTDVSNSGNWAVVNGGNWIVLPAGAANQANLRFRWTFTRTTTSGNYRIDDFTVQGSANSAPTVTSSAATSINTSSATLNGNVTSAGSTSVTDRGFCYKNGSGVTTNDNKTTVAGTTGSFSLSPSLAVNTQYYFVAYAINSVGTKLSTPELSFWTLANTPAAPVVGNPTASSLDVAVGTGDGNPSTTAYAIQEAGGQYVQAGGTLGASAVYQTASSWGSAGTVTVTSLSPATSYGFTVQARNGAGITTSFGPSTSGMTGAAVTPTLSVAPGSLTFAPTAVGGTSAEQSYSVSGVNLSSDISITAPANFEISTTSGSGFSGSLNLSQSGGIVNNTTVYVHFKPTAQTVYSGNITQTSTGANSPLVALTGTGANAPSVSTQPASAITTSGATFNGTIVSSNNALLTDRGFYFKASAGVTTSDTLVSEGGTAQSTFSKSVTGLNPNQVYYFRAYGANSIGTTLDSSDTSFVTLANTPAAPTIGNPSQTSLQVAIGSGDGNPSATTYAIQEAGSAKYVQADGTLAVSAVFQTASVWGTKTLTGLTAGQVYSFQVQAQNGASVLTAFGPATTMNTANPPFTPGDLALLSPDNGSASGTTFSIVEINPNTLNQSAPVQKISINGTIGNPGTALIMGTSGTSGGFSTSSDGSLLVFPGYNTTNTATGANTLVRGVGTLDASGVFRLASTYTGVSGNQTRGATTIDNTNFFWADKGGVYTNGAIAASVAQNVLRIRSFGNTVYVMNAQNLSSGIIAMLAPDASSLVAMPGIPNTGGGSAADFYLIQSGNNGTTYDVLYRADSSGSSGTIFKYSLVSGQWVANATYTATIGSYAICAAPNGSGGATLYIATGSGGTGNKIEKLTDSAGYNAAISITDNGTLYTAPGTSSFKCVSFAPKAPAPTIVSAPSSVSVISGNPATFTLVATSVYPLSYQWQQNGTNLDGETNATLTIPNVPVNYSGYTYQCVAYNSYGSVTSTPPAILTVTTVTTPPTISGNANLLTNFVAATQIFPTVAPGGTAPFTYQWYHESILLVDDGVKFVGSTTASLTVSNLTVADAGNYYLTATNSAGTASNLVDVLDVRYVLPVISVQPAANTTVFAGSSATLNAQSVGGTLPQTTQWYKNGNALTDNSIYTGSTNNAVKQLIIATTSTNDSGAYTVVVSNAGGSVTSSVAQVTVLASTGPSFVGYSNQIYTQNFDSLPDPGAASVNSFNNPSPAGSLNGIAYSLANPFDFSYPVLTAGNIGGLGLAPMAGWYAAGDKITRFGAQNGDQSTGGFIDFGPNDNGANLGTNRAAGLLSTDTTGGTAFAVKLVNNSGGPLNYIDLSYVGQLWRRGSSSRVMSLGYVVDNTGNTFVLTYSAATNSTLVSNLSFSFPTGSGTSPVDPTQPGNSLNLSATNIALATTWQPGGSLWLVWYIDYYGSGSGNGYAIDNLSFRATAIPYRDQNAFLTAYDSGAGFFGGENLITTNLSGMNITVWSSPYPSIPVTSWTSLGLMNELQLHDGTSMSRYSMTVVPTMSPTYYILAETNVGPYTTNEPVTWLETTDYNTFTVTSSNAVISSNGVFDIPTASAILQSPVATSVYLGKSASLSVSATGTGTLTYQWLRNGNPLSDGAGVSGSQTASLTLSPAAFSMTADYSVVVSNALGNATSDVAHLSVIGLPSLLTSNSVAGLVLGADGGVVGNTYIIQRAASLTAPVTWLPVSTNVIGMNGQIRFTETNLTGVSGFYRVQLP